MGQTLLTPKGVPISLGDGPSRAGPLEGPAGGVGSPTFVSRKRAAWNDGEREMGHGRGRVIHREQKNENFTGVFRNSLAL